MEQKKGSSPNGETAEALSSLTSAIEASSANTKSLQKSVILVASAVSKRVTSLEKLFRVNVIMLIILVILVLGILFSMSITLSISRDSRYTADLLLGCLSDPKSDCAKSSKAADDRRNNQTRQTLVVIALCQRQNPLAEDPEGIKVITCLQEYYPDLSYPEKAIRAVLGP